MNKNLLPLLICIVSFTESICQQNIFTNNIGGNDASIKYSSTDELSPKAGYTENKIFSELPRPTSTGNKTISVALSYLNSIDSTKYNAFGLGIKFGQALSEKFLIMYDFNYYFPYKSEYKVALVPLYTNTPSTTTVDVTNKITLFQGVGGIKNYFIGDIEEDNGFYGCFDINLLYINSRYKVGTYDEDIFQSPGEDQDSKRDGIFVGIGGGVGAEHDFDFGYLFVDLKFIIPVISMDKNEKTLTIPNMINLSTGIRF